MSPELEQTQRELQLKIREDNLKTMQELSYAEHIAHTETIKKISKKIISELNEAGHICVQGERMTRMETKIDAILENQKEHKDNSKRIDRIETIGWGIGLVIGGSWLVFAWIAEKVQWK